VVRDLIDLTIDCTHRNPIDVLADTCVAVGETIANYETPELRLQVLNSLHRFMYEGMEKALRETTQPTQHTQPAQQETTPEDEEYKRILEIHHFSILDYKH